MAAKLTVVGRDVTIEGPEQHVVDFTMSVISVSTGRILRYDEDPEEWARSLVGAYRSPYLLAQITHDDNHPSSGVPEQSVRIRQRV